MQFQRLPVLSVVFGYLGPRRLPLLPFIVATSKLRNRRHSNNLPTLLHA